MEPQGKNLIGLSEAGDGDATFKAYNPTTGMVMEPDFVGATPGEVDRALQLAGEALPMPAMIRALLCLFFLLF